MWDLQQQINELETLWAQANSFMVLNAFLQFSYRLYMLFIVIPMYYLYVNAPSFGPVGGYGGRNNYEICQQIAQFKTSVDFWNATEQNRLECKVMLMKNFASFMAVVNVLLYVLLLYTLVKLITSMFQYSVAAVSTKTYEKLKLLSSRRSPLKISPRRTSPKRSATKVKTPTLLPLPTHDSKPHQDQVG